MLGRSLVGVNEQKARLFRKLDAFSSFIQSCGESTGACLVHETERKGLANAYRRSGVPGTVSYRLSFRGAQPRVILIFSRFRPRILSNIIIARVRTQAQFPVLGVSSGCVGIGYSRSHCFVASKPNKAGGSLKSRRTRRSCARKVSAMERIVERTRAPCVVSNSDIERKIM